MVSVIMPVYNTEEYLPDALNSVVNQTYSDWELIAVDDGSTDRSGYLLDLWASHDQRIRVIHTSNHGISAARNTGLNEMKGDFIQFLDSDDRLASTALEESLKSLSEKDVDMVIFDAYYEGLDTDYQERTVLSQGVYSADVILEALVTPSIPPYAWNKFCKRHLYDDVRFPDGEKWEDIATTFYTVSRAKWIAVLARPLYYYRQRSDSITKAAVSDHSIYKWRFKQYSKRYEFVKQNYPCFSDVAKNSVLTAGLLYYAYFRSSLCVEERKSIYRYLSSKQFRSGISKKKLIIGRVFFMLFPVVFSCFIKVTYR